MKVNICPNLKKDPSLETTNKVAKLLIDKGADVYAAETVASRINGAECGEINTPDMIVVLGGDGSIMRASKRAAELSAPILGIDLGRVGYLAELSPDDVSGLTSIIDGNYYVEKRIMIEAYTVKNGEQSSESFTSLNDVVLTHGKLSHILETEVFCDGDSIGRYRSDGFIVSTPTGSTAYSLSAGGPILSPSLRGICLTPICPHSLSAKPIIVPDDSDIEIKYLYPDGSTAHLTVDGVESAVLCPGDSVRIRRSDKTADFIRAKKEGKKSFYDVLKEKMSDV